MNSINPYSNTNQNMYIYEYSVQPTNLDEYENSFATEFELQNLHSTELKTDRLSQRWQNIIAKWFSAPDNRKDTSQRVKLYEKTVLVIDDLIKVYENKEYGNIENIQNLIDTIKEEFYKHTKNDSEALAKWIASNSSHAEGPSMGVVGAYHRFHQLFSVINQIENDLFSNSNSMDVIEVEEPRGLEYINKTAINYIDQMKNEAILIDDVKKYIFSLLKVKDLIPTQQTSITHQRIACEIIKERLERYKHQALFYLKISNKHNEKLVLPEIIKRLNTEQISIRDLNFTEENRLLGQITSVKELINFFGNSVDQVSNLDLRNIEFKINTTELDEIAETFNLKSLKLGKGQSFDYLHNNLSLLTSLCIREKHLDTFSNIQGNYPNLTKLECAGFGTPYINILDKCPLINEIIFNQYYMPLWTLCLMNCKSFKKIIFASCTDQLDLKLLVNFPLLTDVNFASMTIISSCDLPNISRLGLVDDSVFDSSILNRFPNLKVLVTNQLSNFSTFTLSPLITDLKLIDVKEQDISILKNTNFKNITLINILEPININELNECLSMETLDISNCEIKDFDIIDHPSLNKIICDVDDIKTHTVNTLVNKGVTVVFK
ncbi:MAG TPA: hypothetical protein VGP47_05055 [Parachlamydiaceae bacterium]|nr:hypothetical protein [Parachlamydiaceae bacterium]